MPAQDRAGRVSVNLSSQEARHLRKLTGTSRLETVLRRVVRLLARHCIPHFVIGGIAVQEHGYCRTTLDIDIVVPNADEVRRLLAHGFPEVKVFQGGEKMLPVPAEVSSEPQILPLNVLIGAKLATGRAQDFADAVELIKKNSLPKEYIVSSVVRADYEDAWSTAMAEQAAERLMREPEE